MHKSFNSYHLDVSNEKPFSVENEILNKEVSLLLVPIQAYVTQIAVRTNMEPSRKHISKDSFTMSLMKAGET